MTSSIGIGVQEILPNQRLNIFFFHFIASLMKKKMNSHPLENNIGISKITKFFNCPNKRRNTHFQNPLQVQNILIHHLPTMQCILIHQGLRFSKSNNLGVSLGYQSLGSNKFFLEKLNTHILTRKRDFQFRHFLSILQLQGLELLGQVLQRFLEPWQQQVLPRET